jgi:hypothetical protein
MRCPRKIFGQALHPKTMQVYTRKLRAKTSALLDREPYRPLPHLQGVFVGIVEGANRA